MDKVKLKLGQAVGMKELVATLVVSGILLIVGTVVFAKVSDSMNGMSLSNETNATIDSIESTALF